MVTIEEYAKCEKSVVYFAQNYVDFELTDTQIKTLENFQNEKLFLLNACRQYGKSFLSTIYVGWVTIFKYDQYIMVLTNKNDCSVRFLSQCKLLIDGLKEDFKIEFKESSKNTLLLNNGSRISVGTPDGMCGRGKSPQLIIVEEVAFCKNFKDFFVSVYPIVSSRSDTQFILTGTKSADKMNIFYRMYLKSQNPNFCWKSQGVDWTSSPYISDNLQYFKNRLSKEQFENEFHSEFPITYPVNESPLEEIFFDYDGKLRILCDEGLLTIDKYSQELADDMIADKIWFDDDKIEWFVSQNSVGAKATIHKVIRESFEL